MPPALATHLPKGTRAALAALALLTLVLVGSACGGSGGGDGKLVVVATTTQIGDFAREVAGADAEVHQLLQPNSDPHDYEPRPQDVRTVAAADIVYASGDDLDAWIEEVVADSGTGAEIVDLGATAPIRLPGEGEEQHAHAEEGEAHAEEEQAEDDGHHHDSKTDPHWWHDPRNAGSAVAEIERTMAAADPASANRFAANAAAYGAELKALDGAIAACLDSVPAAARKIVTDHDAFNYFANRYGIEIVGAVIPSQTTQAQPSAKELSELAATIEAEGVKAVFPESSVSSKVAQAIASQTGASAEYTLYGDTLGPEGSDGVTYLQMERANADAVVRGLTGGARGCFA